MKELIVESSKLKHNLKIVREIIEKNNSKTKLIAVIKGNGYGLGLVQYAQFLVENGINFLAVATVEEEGNIIMPIACMKSILCMGIGILLYKKTDKIIELIMRRSNTQKKETIAVDASDKYDQLAKLQQLKEDGAITQSEFEVEKAKILK